MKLKVGCGLSSASSCRLFVVVVVVLHETYHDVLRPRDADASVGFVPFDPIRPARVAGPALRSAALRGRLLHLCARRADPEPLPPRGPALVVWKFPGSAALPAEGRDGGAALPAGACGLRDDVTHKLLSSRQCAAAGGCCEKEFDAMKGTDRRYKCVRGFTARGREHISVNSPFFPLFFL